MERSPTRFIQNFVQRRKKYKENPHPDNLRNCLLESESIVDIDMIDADLSQAFVDTLLTEIVLLQTPINEHVVRFGTLPLDKKALLHDLLQKYGSDGVVWKRDDWLPFAQQVMNLYHADL